MGISLVQIHGGLGECTSNDQWLPYSKTHLEKAGFAVTSKNFPNPIKTDYKEWMDFLFSGCKPTKNTVLIGHSMGAVLSLRYAMENKLGGLVIVSGFFTTLKDDLVKKTNFIPNVWNWKKIKANSPWIIQYHTKDDPYITVEEARKLSKLIDSEYYEFEGGYHLGNEEFPCAAFPHLVSTILAKLK